MQLKVTYVDDEEDLLEMFSDLFSSKEIVVSTFSDPAKAREDIRKNHPDLLVLDYRLPGITGDVLAQELPASIPKILITGDLQLETQTKFLGIYSKPYPVEEISELLQKLLQQKKEIA